MTAQPRPSLWTSPTATQVFTLVQYGFKAVIKIVIGLLLRSGVFLSEGIHGSVDLVQSGLILAFTKVDAKERVGYAHGYREIGPLLSSFIGLFLSLTAIGLMTRSLLGLIGTAWPVIGAWIHQSWIATIPLVAPQTIRIESRLAPWLLGISIASFLLSRFTGWRQTTVGKLAGYAQLVDDGKETLADGWVDLVVIASVISAQYCHLVWPEFVFGLVASGIMFHTALSITIPGVHCIMKKSLGESVHQAIGDAGMNVFGVRGIIVRKTYRIGSLAHAELDVMSVLNAETHATIVAAIQATVGALLINHELGIRSSEVNVTIVPVQRDAHRILYALERYDDEWRICPIQDATHYLLVDMEYGAMVKGELFDLSQLRESRTDWIHSKHIRTIRVYLQGFAGDGVEIARSIYLRTFGIALP